MSSEKANEGDVARAVQMLKESNKKMITSTYDCFGYLKYFGVS